MLNCEICMKLIIILIMEKVLCKIVEKCDDGWIVWVYDDVFVFLVW